MKSLKILLNTLLICLSLIFVVYPKIIFAYNSKSIEYVGNTELPVILVIAIVVFIILAFSIYIAGEVVNRK